MPCHQNIPSNRHKGPRQAYLNRHKFNPWKYGDDKKPDATFLAAMTSLCCFRCAKKLYWKIEFGKYVPLERPRKCNLCPEKRVGIAYHHICQECARARLLCAKCQVPAAKCYDLMLVPEDSSDEQSSAAEQPEGEEEEEGEKDKKPFPFDIPADDEEDQELLTLRGLDVTRLRQHKRHQKHLDTKDARGSLRERERRTLARKEAKARETETAPPEVPEEGRDISKKMNPTPAPREVEEDDDDDDEII